jgi:hypothetical protein
MVPSYPTPEDTANGIVRLGNLRPGVDPGAFLVVFALLLIIVLTTAYLAAVTRRSRVS